LRLPRVNTVDRIGARAQAHPVQAAADDGVLDFFVAITAKPRRLVAERVVDVDRGDRHHLPYAVLRRRNEQVRGRQTHGTRIEKQRVHTGQVRGRVTADRLDRG
jgi:hypothetical protein